MALSTNLKLHTSAEKGLKQKDRTFWGIIPTFVEVTGEKLIGGAFCSPPSWIRSTIKKRKEWKKIYGWDKIFIRLIKLCSKTIVIPSKLLFRSTLEEGVFPDDWKKTNVVPIHKKKSLKTWLKKIDPLAFSLFSVKFLKDLYLISCSIIWYKTNYSLSVNLASFQLNHVLLNSTQLLMKSKTFLIVICHTI